MCVNSWDILHPISKLALPTLIVENLNDFYHGCTVVIVAHRLSTVKSAGQIIVIDAGRVVEGGNHTSLIEKKGACYHLVKNQFELGN